MPLLASVPLFLLGVLSLSFLVTGINAHSNGSPGRAIAKSKYSKSHSLGDSYAFDPRDGWQTFNASNLQYKYRRDSDAAVYKKDSRTTKKPSVKQSQKPASTISKAAGIVDKVVGTVWKGLKGIGSPEPVIATWYTGHDLLNPSCWASTQWAPTDASFVCALTLAGWNDKPQCFKFLECIRPCSRVLNETYVSPWLSVCNTPKKCVFVRVVDTCAGCKDASHHVDLTRAPFGEIAAFDEGVLTVQSRMASEPDVWFEDLWGPKNGD
ncbi:hypothetical protein B0H10DRAFT_1987806 [Mycena sp. CBHHK59/15]|nr:hypothetical protein B0H10DRAFT_1987806 [Mycena sp. CBHHK59/15]